MSPSSQKSNRKPFGLDVFKYIKKVPVRNKFILLMEYIHSFQRRVSNKLVMLKHNLKKLWETFKYYNQ